VKDLVWTDGEIGEGIQPDFCQKMRTKDGLQGKLTKKINFKEEITNEKIN
jgi:hypothetical protein